MTRPYFSQENDWGEMDGSDLFVSTKIGELLIRHEHPEQC